MSSRLLPESPAFERNREPIRATLRQHMAPGAVVLEVGSGPGQHACELADALEVGRWYPSEMSEDRLEAILAWRDLKRAQVRVAPPRVVDVLAPRWWEQVQIEALSAVVAINVMHIVSWQGGQALVEGAGRLLPEGGLLYLYGPYRSRERELEASNEAFDASIRARIPGAGLRVSEEVVEVAERFGLKLEADVPMPANNRSLILRRISG